jgi:hypothetical protein
MFSTLRRVSAGAMIIGAINGDAVDLGRFDGASHAASVIRRRSP